MNSIDFYIHQDILEGYTKNLRYSVVYGGRGSGKSFQLGALCVIYALQNKGSRILCVRGTQNKISESSLQILKDVIYMMGIESYFEISEHTLSCTNGSQFLFYGAKNHQSFKSLQGIDLVFVDEATELKKEAWETLIPTIRNEHSKFLISFNPEKEDDWVYDNFITSKHPSAYVTKLNYSDNPFFPEVLKEEMLYDKGRNINKYLHIWEGELIQEVDGALWKTDDIAYIDFKSNFDKIVVALDPSGSDSKGADEAGIIIAGKYDNKSIVLDDISEILSPLDQANKAIKAYYKWGANYIVLEKNGVGNGMKTIIHQIDETILVKEVHARKGKKLRAEPVYALYEQALVKHAERFAKLEYEMVTYTGVGDKSPNRLDAMVYAITELYLNKVKEPKGLVKASTTFKF